MEHNQDNVDVVGGGCGDGGGGALHPDETGMAKTNTKTVEVSTDKYQMVQKLRKMRRSGVPTDALQSRCAMEQIDFRWVLEKDDETNTIYNVVVAGSANAVEAFTSKAKHMSSSSSVFRVTENNGEVEVDFIHPKDPLAGLVKVLVPTIQRRGQLDVKTGTGTYISVKLVDLKYAYGSFCSVQYDRDLYLSTISLSTQNSSLAQQQCQQHEEQQEKENNTNTSNDNHKNKNFNHNRTDDEIRSKRYRFLHHLVSIGMNRVQQSSITKDIIPGLDDLIDYLRSVITYPMQQTESEGGEISDSGHHQMLYEFNDLGYLFRPGTKCYVRNVITTGVDCFVQVVSSRYDTGRTIGGTVTRFVATFELVCSTALSFSTHDEQHNQRHQPFSTVQFTEHMLDFENKRNVNTLPFQPCWTLPNDFIQPLLDQARSRALVYQKVSVGANFMGYRKGGFFPKGINALRSSSYGGTTASRSEGRIMVDVAGAYEAGHSVSTGYDGIVTAIQEKTKEVIGFTRQRLNHQRKTSGTMSSSTNTQSSTSVTIEDGPLLMETIPDYLQEFTWPAVTGFSFKSKVWGEILVDMLYEIQFHEETFDRLVLPASHKRMIKALVRHSSDSFHDIVANKGEGSVFLLYGPPGVGKTLTAEAISEMLHRPLYSVSLGQLGTTPTELEKKMGDILELCSKWDALILLDEADIFLEKRTSGGGSLERNAMVSVMLRLVEYFKGVLFLTSNRVDSLDPAFKTRITLALRYEPLDATARQKVWDNLLIASGQEELLVNGSIQTNELAKYELNGREIKNCVRLALALTAEDNSTNKTTQTITQQTILETIHLMNDFNEKLSTADAY